MYVCIQPASPNFVNTKRFLPAEKASDSESSSLGAGELVEIPVNTCSHMSSYPSS
jgi:hypothetical protein